MWVFAATSFPVHISSMLLACFTGSVYRYPYQYPNDGMRLYVDPPHSHGPCRTPARPQPVSHFTEPIPLMG